MRKRPSDSLSDADYFWRFKSRCIIPVSGCWEWQGACANFRGIKPWQRGYAEASYRGSRVRLARWMLRYSGRPVRDDQYACHTCDNPPCINPDHLFIADAKTNMQDCAAKRRWARQHQTHCTHGHEYTPENTYRPPNAPQKRNCRSCHRVRQRQRDLAASQTAEGK